MDNIISCRKKFKLKRPAKLFVDFKNQAIEANIWPFPRFKFFGLTFT